MFGKDWSWKGRGGLGLFHAATVTLFVYPFPLYIVSYRVITTAILQVAVCHAWRNRRRRRFKRFSSHACPALWKNSLGLAGEAGSGGKRPIFAALALLQREVRLWDRDAKKSAVKSRKEPAARQPASPRNWRAHAPGVIPQRHAPCWTGPLLYKYVQASCPSPL